MNEANTGASAVASGTFGGMIVGTLVSGLVLGAASLMTEIPGAMAPSATTLDVPAGSEFSQTRDDTEATLPGVEATPDAGAASQVDAPVPDDLSKIGEDATETAALPQTGNAEGALNAPAAGDSAAGVEVDSDSPVLPSPQAMAPKAPSGEDDLSISTEPAQPLMPEASEESSAFPDKSEQSDGEGNMDSANAPAPEQEVAALPEAVSEADVEPKAEPDAKPKTSGTFDNLAPEVKTNRLPSVTDTPGAEESVGVAEPVETPAEDTRPPLQRFAVEFENPDENPLMAIVLLDDGTSPIGLDALKSFPYPLSFAVDASWSGAGAAMQAYRDAGFEVLALASLPENANATDTEVAMQAYFTAIPEAVAVMEQPGFGLQSNREASTQLARILSDSGHGLVLFPNGLNTTQKLIAREGVPSATVFRDFDAKGQNATVIRRFLDQAAFKAGQEKGGVIMVGRLRADTISALLLWGLQDRAGQVALAPVSAVLQAK